MKLNREGVALNAEERNKRNQNWTTLETEVTTVSDAVKEALPIAEEALGLSGNLQAQINTLVVEGDSSVEAKQARVDAKGVEAATLKARLDAEQNAVTAQLAETLKKDTGAVQPTDLSQAVKEQMTGGSVAVVGKNAILTENIVDAQVTPNKTTFIKKTRNLFDGIYYPYYISGSVGSTALLNNNATSTTARTIIVPIEANQVYTIKVHDKDAASRFRVATSSELVKTFDSNGVFYLTNFLFFNDASDVFTFTNNATAKYVYVYVSNTMNPRVQVEKNSVPTSYISSSLIDDSLIPKTAENIAKVAETKAESAITAAQQSTVLSESYREVTRNMFDGTYYPWYISGTVGNPAVVNSTSPENRTAVIPITPGETYSIKVHQPELATKMRVATGSVFPLSFNNVGLANIGILHAYNDALKEFTFTNNTQDKFLFVNVGFGEPKLQVEVGSVKTSYVPHYAIKSELVDNTVSANATVNNALSQSDLAIQRLESREIFPHVVSTELAPTDPGARFIEYFDGKMWGHTYMNGDISYSTNEGKTWTVHTNKQASFSGSVHRLLPTNDGEVLAMTSDGLYKSIGWNSGTVTWTESKITKHANATLFQFSFDGNGTKFIILEYANGTVNWADSRNVWISTDMGETFNVVWDSLEETGAEINAITHLHGACYDRWADRFYFSQGHGASGGLYCTTDDGATWVQGKGHRDGVLKSTGIQPMEGDTNGPTVIIATPTGLVMGSDNNLNGMFGLVRKKNPADEVVTRTYEAVYTRKGVIMFAIRGFLDEKSGTVYVAFRAEFNDVPPIICAGTPTEATMIYEYPTLPVVGAQDHFGAIAKTSDNRLMAYAQFSGKPYTFRGELKYPNTEIQTLVRLELKRLGLLPS